MNNYTFYKYSGAGNTFLISKDKISLSESAKRQFITRICDPVIGFSADGVLFLEKKETYIQWDFYNSDGSTAEMCGNAARCAFNFSIDNLYPNEKNPEEILFKTLSGIVKGKKWQHKICIEMPRVKKELGFLEVKSFKTEFHSYLKETLHIVPAIIEQTFSRVINKNYFLSIDTGVPHFILELDSFNHVEELKNLCEKIRHYKIFSRGTNVTLIKINSTDSAQAITFERGVEGYTRACGTGAVAAGIYLGLQNNRDKLNITMPGGLLNIELDEVFKQGKFNFQTDIKNPLLIGDVEYIGKVIVASA